MDPLEHFEFSQSSLQDFTDCRRRFQLRYLQHVAWPAVPAEPARENERHIQRGERFHRLAQQYLLGIPEDRLTRMAEADEDPDLLRWWQNFLETIPPHLDGTRFVEAALAAPLGRFRIVAKYDLVLLRPDGQVVIYDWKTYAHRPARPALLKRLQTRVYPYLLVQAGAVFHQGIPLQPEQVEMIYWFAEQGQPQEQITYTRQLWQEDEKYLQELAGLIASLGSQEYTQAVSETACVYCVYRSLCGRGERGGSLDGEQSASYEPESLSSLDIDLEQIGEISF